MKVKQRNENEPPQNDSLQTTQRIWSFCPFFCNCLLEWLVEGDTFLCILRVLCGEFAVVLVFLSSCHYARPNLSSEEMPQKTKDSLNYLYERHYTWNTNLELTADSILLECLPIKDTYINLYRGDRVVVAEFAVHPADSVDSVWVKLAHTQDEQGVDTRGGVETIFCPYG